MHGAPHPGFDRSVEDESSPESAASAETLRAALARERRISSALREVGAALGTTLDLDDLLELILDKLTELLDADRATLYLLDESNDELVSRIVVGEQIRSIRVKLGHGIAGVVAQTGEPIRVSDAYADPRFEREWDALTGFRTRSMLVVPLKNHLGRTIGVIQVLNKHDDLQFTDEDEEILAALSTQAAVAIDNSRLFLSIIQKNRQLLDAKEQLERGVEDLSLLFDLERATAHAASLEELALASLSAVTKASHARGGALLLAEEETGDLVQYIFDPEQDGELTRIGIKSGEGFLGAALAQSGVVQVREARDHELWNARVEEKYPFTFDSVVALPMEGEDSAIGVLALFSEGAADLTDDSVALLQLVSANVATAVRLFWARQARERTARLTTIGRLLSGVIHDFKTPMTVISGYVQLMETADDASTRAEYAAAILKQFDVLTAMQREVLEFARGERTVFIRRVYLHKFFADLTEQLKLEVEGKPVELVVDVDTKVVARFDEGRLARAIHNLARNAVEAMGERGGTLTVGARKEGTDLVVTVADTGSGIPAEVEGRLFQSFVTAGKKGGTGLGLAIVKKIVEEHDGHISVRSSDTGARFELRIPQPEVSDKSPSSKRRGTKRSDAQSARSSKEKR